MPYCTKCGIPIDGDGNLCASCTSSSKLKDAAKDPIEKIADAFNASPEDHTKSFEMKKISQKIRGLVCWHIWEYYFVYRILLGKNLALSGFMQSRA